VSRATGTVGCAPTTGIEGKIFSTGFTLQINKSPGFSSFGAAKSPRLGQFPSAKFSAKTIFA
jgi:hypothetical protein